jgi:hypothetical protein
VIATHKFVSFALVLGTVSAALLTSCGRASDSPAAKEENKPWILEADIKDAPELIARAKLSCDEASDCPGNVALMIAVTEKTGDTVTFHQCTSFLVADDVIATNSHCVPPKLRQPGAKCSGQIAFVFPSKAGKPQRAECAEVLSATKIDEDSKSRDYLRKIDVAFLKLSSKVSGAAPYKFDRRGLADGVNLKALVIDPVKQGQIEGSLKVQSCNTVQATFANPSYVTEHAAVVTAAGCEARIGNSGAPAIDDDGNVRAVVFGVLPTGSNANEMSGYETPDRFQAITFMSNASCIDTPPGVSVSGVRRSDEICDTRLSQASLRERALKNAGLDLESVFSLWLKSAPPIFGYKLVEAKSSGTNNAFTGTSLPALACVKAPSTWPSAKALGQKFDRFERNGDSVDLSFDVPVWAGTYSLDELYRVSVRSKSVDRARIEAKFDVTSLTEGPVKVELSVKSASGTVKPKSTSVNLKKCDN